MTTGSRRGQTNRLPSCGEVADGLEALPVTLRETRRVRGLSLRQAAELAGVSITTISRIEAGKGYNVSAAIRLLRFLARA